MYNPQISFSQILLGFISSITSGSITLCTVIMISTFVLDFRTILYVCMYVCMYSMLTTNPFFRCLLVGLSLSFSSFLQKCSCKQYSLSSVCYLLYLKNVMTGYEISGSHFNSLSYKHCSTDFWYWMLWQNLRPAWYQPLIKDFVQGMRKMFGCP